MNKKLNIHPLSAKGKYYIDLDICTWSGACEFYAPAHFKSVSDVENGFYVAKQPENSEEEALCQEAMMCCPVEAIFDDGEELA